MTRSRRLLIAAASAAVAVPAALSLSASGASAAPLSTYTVQPGDTLSSIAASHGTTWPTLAAENHLASPNLIFAGQVLTLDGDAPAASAPVTSAQTYPASTPVSQSAPVTSGTSTPSSGTEACIVQHESGGNAQVTNSSGHYGSYQFSEGTWVASGGNPSDFGHASAGEQQQVFNQAVSRFGYQPWAGDGC